MKSVIYVRSSVGNGVALEDQKKECHKYAAKNGYKVVEPPFSDHGESYQMQVNAD